MTTAAVPTMLPPLRAATVRRSLASAGRLPVEGVSGAQELLRPHGGGGGVLDDGDGLRARRREALLHRLELDRQRRRRRTA